jgi:hypothetical protein
MMGSFEECVVSTSLSQCHSRLPPFPRGKAGQKFRFRNLHLQSVDRKEGSMTDDEEKMR